MKKKPFLLIFWTFILILFKYIGLFQPLELAIYDHYWQRSPIEAPDPHIVIVGIDETDLNEVNWPITNDDLANLILKIEAQNPAVIGLDIFRDLGVSGKLKQIFEQSDKLVGVGLHKGVAFPSTLKARDRVGTAAVPSEPVFGELRRIYLYSLADGSEEAKIPYISLKLVWEYLKSRGNLEITGDEATKYLKVNGKVIPRTEEKSGGYSLTGFAGYPYLVRWRKGSYQPDRWEDRFSILTYREAIKAPPETFTDKIVLIGYRAESIKDKFITPLGWRYGVDVVAQTTSDLRSHIQENRPIFNFIPEGLEYGLLILMIALAYGHYHFSRLSNVWREMGIQAAIAFLLLGIIYSSGYVSFRQGLWIPVGQLLVTYGVSVMAFLAMKYQLKIHRANKEQEQKLKEQAEKLKKLYQKQVIEEKQILLGQFATELTHDLNTQLGILSIEQAFLNRITLDSGRLSQWLVNIEEPEDEEWLLENIKAENFDQIAESLGSQQRAIVQLQESLEVLQAVYQGHIPEAISLNLTEELEKIAAKWQERLANQGISLNYSPTPVPEINYSPIIFRQIMNHCLQNAKDAILEKGEDKGEIWLEIRNESPKIKISIKDNGIGMTTDTLAKASQFLFSTKPHGMGYGLYFVGQQLKENLTIESQFRRGTTLNLYFS